MRTRQGCSRLRRVASITRARNPRRAAPHAAAKAFGFRFRALQFIEPGERLTSGHAREPVAHERGVDDHAVLAEHVREPAMVDVERRALLLEAHPAMNDHLPQSVAGFLRERRRRIESMAHLRRVDAEQTDTTKPRNGDCVAVGDGGYDHGIGSLGSRAERKRLSYCDGRNEHSGQNLHTHLRLARDRAETKTRFCNRPTTNRSRTEVGLEYD